MLNRPLYLNRLISLKDKQLIKIITGIRRCGKSALFELFQDYLLQNGVSKQQIQSINFEENDNEDLQNYKLLYQHIKKNLVPDKMNYIFLDEIQNVPEFQKTVDSLYIQKNVDLYVTGSNAYLLSGELATLLSGRYIEINMLPLSFKEYSQAFPNVSKSDLFPNYIQNSSFPYAIQLQDDPSSLYQYLDGIYNTILIKDIANRKKMTDTSQLHRIVRFMADNIGNITSIKKISDTMKSDRQDIAPHTVDTYLTALKESFILYAASRYDVKGKEYLKTGEKYYLADVGLRYMLLGNKAQDFGHILENIVYLELLRRGYKVYVGKVGTQEVDFIALKGTDTEYYQVSLSVLDKNTLQRELSPLEKILDHNPKFLLTLDALPVSSHNGIKQINALDWLLDVADR